MSALLEVSGVTVSFDGFKAINNLSFSVGDSELRAVIGPNGAGKTTFMDIVTGKTKPDAGHIKWGDENVSLLKYNESQIAQKGIGRKFQRPTVFENQTVSDNLMIAQKAKRGALSALFFKQSKEAKIDLFAIATDCGLELFLETLAGELSHGQKQWLEIAMLLAQAPKLLLIDEPAAGMTLEERIKTAELFKRVSQSCAVIVVEHDMDFVRRLDCRVTVLHEGAVLAEGSLDHVTQNEQVIDVYLGR